MKKCMKHILFFLNYFIYTHNFCIMYIFGVCCFKNSTSLIKTIIDNYECIHTFINTYCKVKVTTFLLKSMLFTDHIKFFLNFVTVYDELFCTMYVSDTLMFLK